MAKIFKSKDGEELLLASYDRLLQTWDLPYEEQFIMTRFGETHVITAGDKDHPPLVLFHGVGDNSAIMWIYNMRALAERFFVVAVDTLGAPGKSKPNETYDMAFESTLWIDDLLDGLRLERVHMAGVSYGVTFILQYAMQRPQRVLNMVCMAGSFPVKGWVSKLRMLRSLTAFLPEALYPNERSAARLLKKLSGPDFELTGNPELLAHFVYLLKYSIPPRRKMIEFRPEDFEPISDR
ncbi:alpha/beta fold hydrolase [Paenibacillus sp. N1-5-1-14]|uniref:alpha/beta fold hydrolase n=1 Tax=Paenibacillus radicibacter TaxID=2972488 RepID=UPI002158F380|nr:alpha/beta fold hydrolase [Paenibacillus radicibacter]MCR8645927.1 alpha/beta fold hydrolase [Paenibacillus radicibacter]